MKPDLKRDNKGAALVEMIVTFALTAIFMAAAAAVISSSVIVHSELTGAMYAQSVSGTLLDKITGELAAARAEDGKTLLIGETGRVGGNVGNGAAFYDREGRAAYFFVRDGRLILHYRAAGSRYRQEEEAFTEEEEWALDPRAYMGYRITDLQLTRLNEENVLEAVIKIKNIKTGFEYTASECLECYNFRTKEDFEKITEGIIPKNR